MLARIIEQATGNEPRYPAQVSGAV
jgi:hypothetical protein